MKITERKERISLLGGQEDLNLLHISDIHLWYSTRILDHLTCIISKHNPDIIILTGDYYDIPKGAYNFRNFLSRTAEKHLVILIKGNHDMLYGEKTSNFLSGIPNCICVDDTLFKYKSERGFIYNITSWQNKALLPLNNDDVNIVLIHNPEKIKADELSNINLILAGHLHGGQFIFFKTRSNSYFPGNLLYRYCTDRKQIMDTTLIVSKGLGDTFPLRMNCPREVVRLQIN